MDNFLIPCPPTDFLTHIGENFEMEFNTRRPYTKPKLVQEVLTGITDDTERQNYLRTVEEDGRSVKLIREFFDINFELMELDKLGKRKSSAGFKKFHDLRVHKAVVSLYDIFDRMEKNTVCTDFCENAEQFMNGEWIPMYKYYKDAVFLSEHSEGFSDTLDNIDPVVPEAMDE